MEKKELKNDIGRYGATFISVNSEKGGYLADLINGSCSFAPVENGDFKKIGKTVAKHEQRESFRRYYVISTLEKAKIKSLGRKLKIKSFIIKLKNS